MNPIFLSALSVFLRKAKCPKCQRDQLLTHRIKQEGFRCKFCGNIILPPKKS